MKNKYYTIRHGESTANREKIIISSPENGINGYGLTSEGKAQVESVAKNNTAKTALTRIISSDFLRAQQTAQVFNKFYAITLTNDARLRERNFAPFEKMDDSSYTIVWEHDKQGLNYNGVESVLSVAERMMSVIFECERDFSGETILLVSHGDPLQILTAKASKIDPCKHRDIPHIDKGELKELIVIS